MCVFVIGVLDDEDVRVMLQGSKMVKVRSQRWRKDRRLKLLEDCVTVWCESSKSSRKGKRQQTCEYCVSMSPVRPVVDLQTNPHTNIKIQLLVSQFVWQAEKVHIYGQFN